MDQKSIHTPNGPSLSNTDAAFERTILAHERTLMAWVRTAISLISFGFAIYKFFQDASRGVVTERLLTPRVVGMIMIAFGLLSLLLAQIQHHQGMSRLRAYYPHAKRSLSSLMAIMLWVFGILLFLGALYRQ